MTAPQALHPEDVKAKIRKSYGSLLAFERAHQLGRRSVTDFLIGRGRPSVAKAVAELFGHDVVFQAPASDKSACADDSATNADAHRQNAEAI